MEMAGPRITDHGDQFDFSLRLKGLRSESDRKVVFIVGSGLSNDLMPTTLQMTGFFRSVIPSEGLARFDESMATINGTGLGYQNAASLVKRMAGDIKLARTIRRCVLDCITDIDETQKKHLVDFGEDCNQFELSHDWPVSTPHSRLADYIASLPASQHGPIITTNFDPLLEIALRSAGVPARAVPIPLDNAPTKDQLYNGTELPVLHIHGYWTSDTTLSTIGQLTRERPTLANLLDDVLQNVDIVVIGYGGWLDAFMRFLVARINTLHVKNSQILWSTHDSDPLRLKQHESLSKLEGVPAVHFYLGVEAGSALADANTSSGLSLTEEPKSQGDAESMAWVPFGYSSLDLSSRTENYDPLFYLRGGQPMWDDAAVGPWPVLASTQSLYIKARKTVEQGGGRGHIALGAMGEGKSLALRQVATKLKKEFPDHLVLWRGVDGSQPTQEWFSEMAAQTQSIIICFDDADLVGEQLTSNLALWARAQSGVTILMACQDRLWNPYRENLKEFVQEVSFAQISLEDAREIRKSWDIADRVDLELDNVHDLEERAQELFASSQKVVDSRNPSLFGAVLEIREESGLGERLTHLLETLKTVVIRDSPRLSLAEIYGAICLIQVTNDLDGNLEQGTTKRLLRKMIDIPGVSADGLVLQRLGREAAIAFSGGQVYARHPSIASMVVSLLRQQGLMSQIAKIVGRAGGSLRAEDQYVQDGSNVAYRIGTRLTIPDEMIFASHGAMEGAPKLLEPRVTHVRLLRKSDLAKAERYIRGLAPHVNEYDDSTKSIRAFYTECSHVLEKRRMPVEALGLAALVLHDRIGWTLDEQRARYGLIRIFQAGMAVGAAGDDRGLEMAYIANRLLISLCGQGTARRFISPRSVPDNLSKKLQSAPPLTLCATLSSTLDYFAHLSVKELKISSEVVMPLEYVGLSKLV